MVAKKGLGKGLGALISGTEKDTEYTSGQSLGVVEIDINKIEPNKDQPRKYFDDEALHELAASLKEFGVIQPIIVKEEDGYYSIVAGERRWRAARLAKIEKVPVIVKDYTEMDILQIALIENIQRQDLNPIEEALCYKRLVSEYFFTQEDIATKVGKSRNSISYALGLLNLDERVQNFIIEGKLTAGAARQLLPIKNGDIQFELAELIIDSDASVRESEKLVKTFLAKAKEVEHEAHAQPPVAAKHTHFAHMETELRHIFGTKVNIKDGKNKGKIEIEYYSDDELDRLLGFLKKMAD